ncbi:MAG: Fic family protein [Solirubrobacterales bacterium]
MHHVAVLAADPEFDWTPRIILDLQFEACSFQDGKHPGLYRTGPISVTGPRGEAAYKGPPASRVAQLCRELTKSLANPDQPHPIVAAAMAHLNLVSIHPFEDGNGRISRILQSLVLARQGILAPEFGSIEQYLAEDTTSFYETLGLVQKGSYSPENDASPWVEFCVEAHLVQAERRTRLIAEAAKRWSILEGIVARQGWDDRLVIALEQAHTGKTDRARYGAEADVATATASTDLRRLVDSGYLDQVGQGRTTSYVPSPKLRRELDAASGN